MSITVSAIELLQQEPGTTITLTTRKGSKWYVTVTNAKRPFTRGSSRWLCGLAVATTSKTLQLQASNPRDFAGESTVEIGQDWRFQTGHTSTIVRIEVN